MKAFSRYFSLRLVKGLFLLMLVDLLWLAFVRRMKTNAVVIVKLDRLGDYLFSRKFLRLVRTHPRYQSRKIYLCADINLKELIETYDADAFDGFVWVDQAKLMKDARYRFTILRQLKQLGAETVIHPTYARETFVGDSLVFATRARNRIGRESHNGVDAAMHFKRSLAAEISDLFYNRIAPEEHDVIFDFDRYRSFFSRLLPGIEMPEDTRFTAIPVATPEIAGPFAVIMPGAGQASREWPVERFANIARHLYSTLGCRCVILGSAADKGKAATMRKTAPGIPIDDLCGKLSLTQTAQVMSQCIVGVSNYSGGVHLLAALGKPGVAISDGSSFGHFHPYPDDAARCLSFVYPASFYTSRLTLEQLKVRHDREPFAPIAEVTSQNVVERLEAVLNPPFRDPIKALRD